jgi:hypothetical protein
MKQVGMHHRCRFDAFRFASCTLQDSSRDQIGLLFKTYHIEQLPQIFLKIELLLDVFNTRSKASSVIKKNAK